MVVSVLTAWGCGSEHGHWGYEGETGPAHWAQLSAENAACGTGRSQSPIDIVATEVGDLPPLVLHYDGRVTGIMNNGHAVQLDVEPGNWMEVNGRRWPLAQVHFHGPSEHHIGGVNFPLEAHFVHRNDAGDLAVLAVLFREGESDAVLPGLSAPLPRPGDPARPLSLPLRDLAPSHNDLAYFRYDGSLTTPPCTEGVQWHVLQSARPLAPGQLSAFTQAVNPNARDIQPLHARLVRR